MSDYDYDGGRSPLASTLRTILGTLIFAIVAIGILGGVMAFARSERTETTIVEPGEVGQVKIEATIANVTLKPARGDELEFRARITDGLSKTFYVLGKRGTDTYVIDASCRRWLAPACGVDVEIGVPDNFPIEVQTSSGNVIIGNAQGIVTVTTEDGDVTAESADLVELSATTSGGNVLVSFASAPLGFKAVTKSGNVVATLPRSEIRYSVDVTSRFGQVVNELASAGRPDGFVTIESSSGDVKITWSD